MNLIAPIIFLLITLIIKIIQKEKGSIIILKIIESFLFGLLVYPGITISYYVLSEGKTFFSESITIYYPYLAIAWIILIVISIYSQILILKKEKSKRWIKKQNLILEIFFYLSWD